MDDLWDVCNSLRYVFYDAYDSPFNDEGETPELNPNDSEDLEE